MTQSKNDPILDKEIIIGKNYILWKQIGKGSFGEIYQGTEIKTQQFVAIKIVIMIRKKSTQNIPN